MDNKLTLSARVVSVSSLRYTPAGVPVLSMMLKHQSEQIESGKSRIVECELAAKFLGQEALNWQYVQDKAVLVSGFLSQKSLRSTQVILHIQTIELI
ncbi:primosomal replication protein N [Neisseria sp. Ec49-e6-T10]|uniref:primosomal replication protein N n=1 Tax=Neisseria sp. Ec49-e6-T10 TaxID=3140744 RepID=UPI003EBB411C